MDIMKIGVELLKNKLGQSVQQNVIQSALGKLMGGGASEQAGGGVNLAGLMGKMQSGGMQQMVGSWIGTGANEEISEQQVEGVFGQEQVAAAAQELGTDKATLLSGLKEALPQMVDKASPNGSLLDSVGGVGAIGEMAKGLFKK